MKSALPHPIPCMKAAKSKAGANWIINRFELCTEMIRRLVPWPALHESLARDLDEAKRIAKERGLL